MLTRWTSGRERPATRAGTEASSYLCGCALSHDSSDGVALQGGAVVNASAPVALNALSAGSGGGTVNGDVSLDGPLVVEVDANGDVQTVRINGDLTIGASATVIVNDYTQARKAERHTVLSVSGTAAGTFASSNVTVKPWKLYRVGDVWYLTSANGTCVIFR